MAIWCYRQDTHWNGIVRSERTFPDLEGEDFISNKRLVLYNADEGMRHAKKNLLRENRWLELMHMMFMSAFLILTLFQLAAYVTRGSEDHSRLIICYYTVFGGLGLIIALFPLLSWHNQENGYKVAIHYLQDFSKRVWRSGRPYWKDGITNGTAQDSWTLGQIMRFCHDVSQDGVTIEEDVRKIDLFYREYRLGELQYFGFCTHHKFKIVNTVISTIFALLCCAIPCIYCFQAGEQEKVEKTMSRMSAISSQKQQMQQLYAAPPPPPSRPYPPEMDDGGRDRRRPRTARKKHTSGGGGGESLTDREANEIEKFRRYIEGDDDDD